MLTILGPTASGKTRLAVALARALDAEIISADSRQVYRRMDIGTGKDLSDYVGGGVRVPVHLVDICEPGYKYNVYEFQRDFLVAYQDIRSRGHAVVFCGGSGLYLESVLRGYKLSPVPQNAALRTELSDLSLPALRERLSSYGPLHNVTDLDTPSRAIRAIEIAEWNKQHPTAERPFPRVPSFTLGVSVIRETRRQRITARLRERLQQGLVEEIQSLLSEGIPSEELIYYGLEYKYVTLYVLGRLSYEEMFGALETAIHQFAKRQMTWFRGMERRGVPICWVPPLSENEDIQQWLTSNDLRRQIEAACAS